MPSWRPISSKMREMKDSGLFLLHSTTKQVQEDHVLANLPVRSARGAQESILTMKVSCTNITLQPVEQLAYIQEQEDQMTLCLNNPQLKTLWCLILSSWTRTSTKQCKGYIHTGSISANWLRWSTSWIWKRVKEYLLITLKWQWEEE